MRLIRTWKRHRPASSPLHSAALLLADKLLVGIRGEPEQLRIQMRLLEEWGREIAA